MFSSNTSQTSGGYEIQRSLRFNSADSAYLNRTPASAGNRKTFTLSGWVKRSKLTGSSGNNDINNILSAYSDTSNYSELGFLTTTTNSLSFVNVAAGSVNVQLITTATYRDPSAWYHVVLAVDTTQATASNRVKVYVNGDQVTAFSTATYPAQNADLQVNNAVLHQLGRNAYPSFPQNFDGYMTEVNFIDGQALTPSSFGAFDAQTGVWGPTRYAGSYGTNGFYLNFSDNSNTTATTLGRDYSGNSNNWTPNNFSVSAGNGNDSMVDVPTNWGTDTGVGGSVRGNYATLNPLDQGSTVVLSNGNLNVSITSGLVSSRATFGVASGKWYWEATCTTVSSVASDLIGIGTSAAPVSNYFHISPSAYGYAQSTGDKWNNNSSSSYGASWTTGDVIGVALDLDAGTLVFYKNGTSQGTAFSSLTGTFFPMMFVRDSVGVYSFNFGQRPFAYTAPSGFRALNTQNLPTPTIGATTATQAGKFFNPVLYTGNGFPTSGTQSVSGVGFQPDWVWIKSRSAAGGNTVTDVVRGINSQLLTNTTGAQETNTDNITALNSDGFSLGSNTTGSTSVNVNGHAYVAWNWRANGTGVTNTAGTITSTVSANTTSGFSIATFSLGATGSQTVGHGLGVAPRMIIVKNRTTPADFPGWYVYHISTGNGQYLTLNTTGSAVTASTIWDNTSPTSSVFTLGAGFTSSNQGPTQVAYCFAEVPGYSRFGSYTGNGVADGPFVFTGFRPAYVMIKNASLASAWIVYDNKRNTANAETNYLLPNSSGAEATLSSLVLDFTSNGFKIRGDQATINTSNNNYIFACFAESPQKFSLAR
jgi:hypothetical protein